MSRHSASFTPSKARLWNGRYARIPGNQTAFHVRLHGGRWWPFVDWVVGDETYFCPMLESPAAASLAKAINAGKSFLDGSSGGSFLLNEYGQALVPGALGDRRITTVGEWEGPLEFSNEFDGDGSFDLTGDARLKCGDPWRLPYLGIPHNLSTRDEIYFWSQNGHGGAKKPPPGQDDDLIDRLRMLRPSGPVRFVVAYGGVVLTKVPAGRRQAQRWRPTYVGRLNYELWYTKE